MFQTTASIIITSIISLLFVLAYSSRSNPLAVIGDFSRGLIQNRLLCFHFLGALSILGVNKLELLAEPYLTEFRDWTPYIRMFEENVTPLVQQFFHNTAFTYVSTFFYVVFFSVLLVASPLIYYRDSDLRSLYTVLYAIGLNYLLAIPFFLFAPVDEAWFLHPDIRFLIPDVYPTFEEQYRHFSGLDNSFPSLHTSLSVTLALIACKSGNRRFARINILSAGVILFAIIYLGIHWYLDLVAGLILGIVSLSLANKLSEIPLGNHQLELNTGHKPSEQVSNM
ncbi:phosphatase PAP2 family protein [Paludifilum halophilum]|uniref:Phosphatidic acid phosphatase type 2/haloperoxidase domain-containing protein n=1 Tax=Paludifilum halophilum TaxID=1642702 RepID=A0A235BC98_9BACL|nr:phosphatase PAP2 family protein [Paludifilum halophilum]OYD09903.1 hypothetical protein CHM34_02710 [Paludifilum halophilum]